MENGVSRSLHGFIQFYFYICFLSKFSVCFYFFHCRCLQCNLFVDFPSSVIPNEREESRSCVPLSFRTNVKKPVRSARCFPRLFILLYFNSKQSVLSTFFKNFVEILYKFTLFYACFFLKWQSNDVFLPKKSKKFHRKQNSTQ